jgi:hypothetical protein
MDELGELTNVVGRLNRDLRESVASLSIEEARYLVQTYYTMQDYRIRSAHQAGQLMKAEKSHLAIQWLAEQDEALETRVRQLLDRWTDSQPMGRWAKTITGIGPVISAGLLAYIDIEKAPTVGHIWRYAGLDPTTPRKKGEKLRYNPDLKVLCYKVGESFVKQQGRESDIYGKLYAQRKAYEQQKNEAGDYKEQAERALTTKKYSAETGTKAIYESGKLPPAHLHARARRWCVKLFLSHWHGEAYRQHFGTEPPLPYPIGILGHADLIAGPVGE